MFLMHPSSMENSEELFCGKGPASPSKMNSEMGSKEPAK